MCMHSTSHTYRNAIPRHSTRTHAHSHHHIPRHSTLIHQHTNTSAPTQTHTHIHAQTHPRFAAQALFPVAFQVSLGLSSSHTHARVRRRGSFLSRACAYLNPQMRRVLLCAAWRAGLFTSQEPTPQLVSTQGDLENAVVATFPDVGVEQVPCGYALFRWCEFVSTCMRACMHSCEHVCIFMFVFCGECLHLKARALLVGALSVAPVSSSLREISLRITPHHQCSVGSRACASIIRYWMSRLKLDAPGKLLCCMSTQGMVSILDVERLYNCVKDRVLVGE